ncbi:Organelle RRM domain-containing protein 6, chloroplastic [Sesamum alatum]|uniref:Organelle RRM domain-containing protein 6, chloroplastic n=1 Tax=Sesamum alatum TaxID=300844 RepID=A0AAE1XZW5_9LAMI|nr:Organelle RRM domain-containing protein 6, chloroplastic [Sesamum alatum]
MAKSIWFLPYSSSTPITTNHRNSKIYSSNFDGGFPLASKIIVKNLPFSMSESRSRKEFSKFGQIAEVKLVKDEARKTSKGYAFIQYSLQDEAMLALETMDHQYFDGRLLVVEIAKPWRNDFDGYPKTSGPPQSDIDE